MRTHRPHTLSSRSFIRNVFIVFRGGWPARTCIELIAVSDPVEATLWEVIESGEIVIAGNTMDRANANLVQAPKQVLGKVHRILKLPCSDVGRRHVELLMADEEEGRVEEKRKKRKRKKR